MKSIKITKAKARVLTKAQNGYVMISGGFSGNPNRKCIHKLMFDKKSHIEDLLAAKLLVPGIGANQYTLSPEGTLALSSLPKSFTWTPNVGVAEDDVEDTML